MYTETQERLMKNAYAAAENDDDRIMCVAGLANKLEKPKASIIAKLAKMGVYVSKKRVSKITKGDPRTKEQIVADISYETGQDFSGLEKAPKLVLLRLYKTIMKII